MTPAQVDELNDGAFAAMVRLIERERVAAGEGR